MENTYTYTARSIEDPEKVVIFTLQDHHMSVGSGAPLEQIEALLEQTNTAEEGPGQEAKARLWLKPLAISLLERGIGPFRVADVSAAVEDDWLRVNAWYRAGGLALAPVTLVNGRVDNPQAAYAFVEELDRRKEEESWALGRFKVLNYWFTWILAVALLFGLFVGWRRRARA